MAAIARASNKPTRIGVTLRMVNFRSSTLPKKLSFALLNFSTPARWRKTSRRIAGRGIMAATSNQRLDRRSISACMEDSGMRSNRWRVLVVVASLLLVAVVLSACAQSGVDPYQAGQAVRQQVDQLMKDLGQFAAGFCSASLLPGIVAVVVAWFAAVRSSK